MRSLKDILKESILDDIDTQIKTSGNDIKAEIKRFLEKNYYIDIGKIKISDKPNKDGLYEISVKEATVKNRSITSFTNGMFIWDKVREAFGCFGCNNLKSLEGAPKVVKHFNCFGCHELESLKGAPKEVKKHFNCYSCNNLKSLEGAPEKVGGDFDCNFNKSLESLEGAPKEVGGDFNCKNCGGNFTEEDVNKICNVKGEIKC